MTLDDAATLLAQLTPAARKLLATMTGGVWDVVATMPGRARQHVERLAALDLVETSSDGKLATITRRGADLLSVVGDVKPYGARAR